MHVKDTIFKSEAHAFTTFRELILRNPFFLPVNMYHYWLQVKTHVGYINNETNK